MIANRSEKLAIIHVAKKQLALCDEDYISLLLGCADIDSASQIETEVQYGAIMSAFEKLGFKRQYKNPLKANAQTVPGSNPSMISKKQEYYIKGLWVLASRAKDEKTLRRLVKRIGKVDDIRFLPRRCAQSVILALRDICWKAGINPDSKAG